MSPASNPSINIRRYSTCACSTVSLLSITHEKLEGSNLSPDLTELPHDEEQRSSSHRMYKGKCLRTRSCRTANECIMSIRSDSVTTVLLLTTFREAALQVGNLFLDKAAWNIL